MDVTTPPQKSLFSDNMSIPKGTSCQILKRRTLMPNTPTSERSDLGFAKDLRFWCPFLPWKVLPSRLQEAREQEEAARMRHVDTKVLSIYINFNHFGVLQSFARHKSSWTWITEHNLWKNIWRVSFRIVEFDCRPLEEEDRQDLIEGLKTKWEQAPRMTFVGDICPLKPDEIRNGQWKEPQSGTRWCIPIDSNHPDIGSSSFWGQNHLEMTNRYL